MIYCPRCDKPIAPGHRCLNRRHFFGMLAGAAAAILAPSLAIAKPATLLGMPIVYSAAVPPGTAFVISRKLYRIPVQLYRGGKLIAPNHEGYL